jgi:ubiquinone/menaquinone biosynthesis C-methylase UbiE
LKVASGYERHLLPHLIDFACGLAPVRREREKVVRRACGRVLEVGIGTGLNLAHYDKSRVARIVGLDPALEMHRLAARRARRAQLDVELIALSAERIPLADASVDSIVMTYTLCSIEDPRAALAEMRRVLAPGGTLLFSEHGLAPEEPVRRCQRRLQPHWSRIAGGCHLDRDIPALLREAGFHCPDLHAGYLPGPRFLAYNYRGAAVVAATGAGRTAP